MIEIDEILSNYKPKSTKELAEWILIATKNLKDKEGKHIYFKLELDLALQIARMMQDAKLEVPTAADEIERLREALKQYACICSTPCNKSDKLRRFDWETPACGYTARAALGEKE